MKTHKSTKTSPKDLQRQLKRLKEIADELKTACSGGLRDDSFHAEFSIIVERCVVQLLPYMVGTVADYRNVKNMMVEVNGISIMENEHVVVLTVPRLLEPV